ncbi:MAG: hypothetical protein GY927_25345 [bacterium]|nr:hypothetical protein [bacterium]
MDELAIYKDKSKLPPLGLLAALFMLLGVTMLGNPQTYVDPLWNSLNLIRMLGVLCMVFFWIPVFFGVRALTDHTPELTLDSQGLTPSKGFIIRNDKSSRTKILWQNISIIRENTVNKQRVIEIELNDEKGFSGSLLQISPNNLTMDPDDLLTQFNNYHQAARSNS